MPMDPKYEELERDIVEEYGAGRVWQEMAKSDYYGQHAPDHPHGIPAGLLVNKIIKTLAFVNAEYTQVRRKEG